MRKGEPIESNEVSRALNHVRLRVIMISGAPATTGNSRWLCGFKQSP